MKQYRDISAKTQSDKLQHYGVLKQENLPKPMREMGNNLSGTQGVLMNDGLGDGPKGKKAAARLDRPHRKSGGRVNTKGKGKTTVNVIVAPPGGGAPPLMPAAMPVPAMPPRPAGPPPMPPGAMGGPPGGMPMGGAPGATMMPRKSGGRVMKAGAGSGEDRLEKIGKKAKPANKDGVANGI